jgi:toxin ParE1/3/4
MHSVNWLERALDDREAIVSYLAEVLANPIAAVDFGDLVERSVSLISQTGTLFRAGKVPGTYEHVLTPTYVLVYRIRPRAKRIEILRILQTRRIR